MAKSLRSKSKRSFRAKKREAGKYAAAEAARLDRLNAKLAAVKDRVLALPDNTAEETVMEDQQGSYDLDDLFACLGILQPRYVTPQNLARFVRIVGLEERKWDGLGDV